MDISVDSAETSDPCTFSNILFSSSLVAVVSSSFNYSPSLPLLLQFRVKWSNRSMDRSTQKLGLAFFRSKSWLGVHLLEREILCTYSGHCVFPPLNCSHLVQGFVQLQAQSLSDPVCCPNPVAGECVCWVCYPGHMIEI